MSLAVIASVALAPAASGRPLTAETVDRLVVAPAQRSNLAAVRQVSTPASVAGLPVVLAPSIKGNVLGFGVRVSAWRTSARNQGAKTDRIGGHVLVSRKGVDVQFTSPDQKVKGGKPYIFDVKLPTRTVSKDGVERFAVKLPKGVATSLRAVPAKFLSQRLKIVVHQDKDTNASLAPYAVRQFAIAFASPVKPASKKSNREVSRGSTRKAKAEDVGSTGPPPVPPPAPFALFNGTPFDLDISVTPIQCASSNYFASEPWPSGVTAMWQQTAYVNGNTGNNTNPTNTAFSSLQAQTDYALSMYSLGKATASGSGVSPTSRGLSYFAMSLGTSLVEDGVKAAITAVNNRNICISSGSAWQVNWTVSEVNASQTAGNVNYWVPSYGSANPLGGVTPTALPVASGMAVTPLSAYNATSANGLALDPAVLANQVGATGSLVMAMLNRFMSPTLNYDTQFCMSGTNMKLYPSYCNASTYPACVLSNQQQENSASTNSSSNYGASAFTGGVAADWSSCSGSGPGGATYYVGTTVLLGLSDTQFTRGGPFPGFPATSAASVGLCAASAAPCITASVNAGTTNTPADSSVAIGCINGSWSITYPWSGKTFSLSNPPSTYGQSSQMGVQLVFQGVSSTGVKAMYALPANTTGGSAVTGGFSPAGAQTWTLSNSNLQAIANMIPGGYVSQWACIMSAYTAVPQGLTGGSANALNLGWNGTPVFAMVANPPGNLTSPPINGGGSSGAAVAAPANVLALGGSGIVAVAWTPISASSSTGIQAVSYVATASSGQTCTTSGTTCTIPSMANGVPVTVTVTVTATSGGVTSAPSAPSAATTPTAAAVPPEPVTPVQNVIATLGAGSVAVAWNAVVTAAGEIAAVSYTARANSGQTCTTTQTSCVIVDVPAGTPVTVTVTTNTSNGSVTTSTSTSPVVMPDGGAVPVTPVPPARLEVVVSAPTSVKAADDFKIKISVGPGSPDGVATVTLYKGGKTTVTLGRVNVLNGKGENNLKIPKSTDKGSYSLRVSFTDNATDQIAKSSGAIKVT